MPEPTGLTRKGERTREYILDTALRLFLARGYEPTTMRDIASEAGCSLGLAYRYFASKEDLILALYQRLARQLEAQALPDGTFADRFYVAMRSKIELVTPYRELLGALFAAAFNRQSRIAVLGDTTMPVRERVLNLFARVISFAADAPSEVQTEQLATLLYGTHLLILLFWLLDHTTDARLTEELLVFVRDMLRWSSHLLRLPPFATALARLARIIQPLLNMGL